MIPLLGNQQALLAILNQQRQLQQAQQSPTTQGLGIGIGQQAQGQMMGQDYRLLDEQTRGMAELQAQGAMIQPNMPTMPTMGKEEKGLLQLAKLFAIGSGIDPRAIAQEEQNYNLRRQQEIQLAHQNATQMALAQANQQMGANKAEQYRLGAEGQITEGRVKRRESDMAARQKREADELAYQRGKAKEDADRTSREKIAEMRDPAAILERFRQQGLAMGMTPEDALIYARSAADKETAAEAARTGAQANVYSEKAKTEAATRDAVVERIVQQGKYSKEQALLVADKRKYLPQEMAFKAAMVELAINKFGENQYQFDTKQAQDALGDIQSQMEDYNGEVKKFEGSIKKLKEQFVTEFGFPGGVLENTSGGQKQLIEQIQAMAVEAQRILSGKPNAEGIAPTPEDVASANKFMMAVRNMNELRKQLEEAYKARDEMNAQLKGQGSAPGKALAPTGAVRNGGDLGRKYMAAGLKYSMARRARGEKGYTDCSHFTQCVYKDMGINIPATAEPQYKASVPVEDEPREGDLLFFRAKSGPRSKMAASHVGIFIGYNKNGEPMMRHASSGAGKIVDVPVSSMDMKFLGARRPK